MDVKEKFLSLIRPQISKYKRIRLGPPYDGGYVLVDYNLADLNYILTFGIGPSIEFERDLVKTIAKKAQVIACDPNVDIDLIKEQNKDINAIILPMALCSPSSEFGYSTSFSEKKRRSLGAFEDHFGFRDALTERILQRCILKVDIEGYEWEVFSEISPGLLKPYEQILLECHFYGGKDDLKCADLPLKTFVRALENLSRYHKLVHIHGNNWENMIFNDEHKFVFPHCFELTYVRKDIDNITEFNNEFFPTIIDVPNKPGFPDLLLGRWPFQ